MGLFDDILKKPTPVAQVNPPADPLGNSGGTGTPGNTQTISSGGSPVIVKSEVSTVFGPESEAEAIRVQNMPASIPSVHAEEDASSVLMASPETSAPIAPVAPAEQPIVVAQTPEPVVAQAATTASTSPEVTSNIMPTPQPIQAPAVQNTPINLGNDVQGTPTGVAQDALQIPAGPSLFEHIMQDEVSATPTAAASTNLAAPQATQGAPMAFSFDATQAAVAPAPVSQVTPASELAPQPLSNQMESTTTVSASSYATPRQFIEKSLENIDTMLETIDARHSAKMTEAEGYRMEKMRFAELEKNAYAEAEIMDRERDHTLRMKSIFEKELDTDEANRTRKTPTHQEGVVEKHSHTHKRHAHEEEEELAIAS